MSTKNKVDSMGRLWLADEAGKFLRDPQGNRIPAHAPEKGPKRIALVGGSFDPPHAGHAAVLRWLIKDNPAKLDDIWILPVVQHAFAKDMAPYKDRAALVQAMIEDLRREPDLRINRDWANKQGFMPTLEVVEVEEPHTVDALEHLHAQHPNTEFVLVFGEDCVADRNSWKNWDQVVALAEILVVSREGFKTVEGFTVHDIGGPEVSSTDIRERLAAGDLTYLIGDGADISSRVFIQIEKRGLYGYKTKTFPPSQVSLDLIKIECAALLDRFKPTEPFSMSGDVRQVLSVRADPIEGHFVFQVLRDTTMEKEHWAKMLSWMRLQTASRARGTDFTEPKPMMKGPSLQYLKQGEPVEGHIDKGTFLGMSGDYAFWQITDAAEARGIFGGLFGGLFS